MTIIGMGRQDKISDKCITDRTQITLDKHRNTTHEMESKAKTILHHMLII